MTALRVAALLLTFTGFAYAAPKPKTGPHGGVVVQLGTYTGEFSVWNTKVDLFVYDSKGKLLHTKGIQGTLEISNILLAKDRDRVNPQDLMGELTPAGDRMERKITLPGLVRADFKVNLLINGVRREGTVTWVHTDDRSRLGDWWIL